MKDSKPRMIAIGLYRPGTGFTRVLQSLFEQLKNYIDIHWVGIGYKGPLISKGFTIYPNNVNGGDAYGAYFARELAEKLNASTIFILNDFWMLKNYINAFSSLAPHIQKIAYVPLDGKITDPKQISEISFLDKLVLYTSFARKQTQKAIAQLVGINPDFKYPSLYTANHGIDPNQFEEMPTLVAKRMCFPDINKSEDVIFILNANRYVPRKGIELSIEAFERSKPQFNKEAYLVLHHGNLNVEEMQALQNIIIEKDLEDSIIINPLNKIGYVSDDQINILYNACEIGINSSYGEGWGLISFEHAATKAAQIVPHHTSCSELWKKAGLRIRTRKDIYFDNNPFMMSEIDPKSLSDHLVNLVNNKETLIEYSNKAYQHARKKDFLWANIAKKWSQIIHVNE